jgi:two-component system, NtrC family, nitrogen regulation sensor histidine kinase NtrY
LQRNDAGHNYSFARYSSGSLIHALGSFPYSFSSTAFDNASQDFSFITREGYEHLIYRASHSALIIVSKPAVSIFSRLSLFSFILFFFSLLFFISYFLFQIVSNKISYPLNLKQRIRSSIVALVLFSFILISIGTVYYFNHKYEQDIKQTVLEKLNILWFTLRDNLDLDTYLSAEKKEAGVTALNNIVTNLQLDFNVYDETGRLFYSSQPKIYELGIVSTLMSPEALFEMRQNERTQYIHPEHIGKLNYISAYTPLTDRDGKITGYANLPYLEKQNQVHKEISSFLSALLTIYMFLLALAVFIALIITSRITKPLLLIQEKLSKIALGQRNENIEWKTNDEIGALVHEYNRMVDELAISAEKLSRSERESAWREMAKQVAHEIKNPLTPMKLHIQHLQRSMQNRSKEEVQESIQRTGKLLIDQIDTLSNIATEFSNFANMPRSENQVLDLTEIISSVISLFIQTPGVEFMVNAEPGEKKIFADKLQIQRVFSNLIKNAIQSLPEGKNGTIQLDLKKLNDSIVVSVTDNGTGIPQDMHAKIFTPNFTTKSSGMGLGLAIVKSSVEQIGGVVWFETKENEGTTFFVRLPAA